MVDDEVAGASPARAAREVRVDASAAGMATQGEELGALVVAVVDDVAVLLLGLDLEHEVGVGEAAGEVRQGGEQGPGGDGGDAELFCRIRKQGNFTEYVPLTLIVLGLLEMSGAAGTMAIGIMGCALVVSRILHPIGMKPDGSPTAARFIGMIGTLPVLLVASIWLIVNYVGSM